MMGMERYIASDKVTPLGILAILIVLIFTQGLPAIIDLAKDNVTAGDVKTEVDRVNLSVVAVRSNVDKMNQSLILSLEIQRQQNLLLQNQKNLLTEYKYLLADVRKDVNCILDRSNQILKNQGK
jgi:hypothetical protein